MEIEGRKNDNIQGTDVRGFPSDIFHCLSEIKYLNQKFE